MELINETIGRYTTREFDRYGSNEALFYVEDGRRFTFKNLNFQINMIAKSLISIGIKKGDHIALISCNSPEWIEVFLAIVRIGAVCVCINYKSTEDEIDYMLKKSKSTILIVSEKDMMEKVDVDKFTSLKIILKMKTLYTLSFVMSQLKRVLDEELETYINAVDPSDMAAILYTSGTTGNPKGSVYNHRALLNGPLSFAKNYKYTTEDTILAALPLNHILGGLYTAFLGLFTGCKIVLLRSFKTRDVLEEIQKERCTGFHGVPTMYQYLLNQYKKYDLTSLRVGMIAGAVSSPTLIKDIIEKLGIHELNNTFGQTETLGVTQTPIKSIDDPKINTAGKAVEHVEIKICDIETGEELPANEKGELYVKSDYAMTEYYEDKEFTKKTIIDGWVHTGDVASIDEEGYLSIKGRIKDIIIKGGENISPSDIEHCLLKMPGIDTVVVVGVPDYTLGEEVFAFVKTTGECEIFEKDVLDYLSGKIAKYKFPRYIEFVNIFPMTSTGKIKRNILKELAEHKVKNSIITEVAVD
ncbi:fatty-acyl-CoA synthase [Clostridium sp. DSM 8431]|uniref:class I adenylate-forming enzyme family protein n=1 Tax=Clostridium sp. DSM 8431 TaxID=1761781 RepID=UPI0008F2A2EA|nr:AMP-binding protein [Clostridium sp. DSM 8431]SFU77877.1 fatty-acyl-CoA synthase [Clostridium sp. DSM 8431]